MLLGDRFEANHLEGPGERPVEATVAERENLRAWLRISTTVRFQERARASGSRLKSPMRGSPAKRAPSRYSGRPNGPSWLDERKGAVVGPRVPPVENKPVTDDDASACAKINRETRSSSVHAGAATLAARHDGQGVTHDGTGDSNCSSNVLSNERSVRSSLTGKRSKP